MSQSPSQHPEITSRVGAILRSTGGNFLEMFDFFLFGFYATYIAKAFFPTENEVNGLLLTFTTFWLGALSGVGASAMAAALAFVLLMPLLGNGMVDELAGAHIRSLMPTHLIDVQSTDKHTVKPWFAAHADVSPVVADFADQGYRLVGGRADYLAHQRAAVVVYQHGAHIINVFSWAESKGHLPQSATRNGYHFVFWRAGDLDYCAVSDTGWDELQGLVRLLRNLSSNDLPRPSAE